MNNFQFDFGMGSNRPKSLNDQKNQTTSSFSSYSYSSSAAQSKPSWQPNKPASAWTHQPAPAQMDRTGLNGPSSMVGDIFGKSWNSGGGGGSTIGIVNKDPNLFGDLVNSAMGQGKGSMNSNVPLKNATPKMNSSSKSPYSMGNVADSLPKTSDPLKTSVSWGSSGGYNGFGSNVNANVSSNKSSNLGVGGPSMKSMGGGVSGRGVNSNKDPFGSLVDFSSKQSSGSLNSANKGNKVADDSFGGFQDASKPKPSTTTFQSSGFTSNSNDFMGSNTSSDFNMGDFGMPGKNVGSQNQTSVNSSGGDPLDMFFSSSSASAGSTIPASGGGGEQQFSGVDDWGFEPDFGGAGGHDEGGSTTELEGLPPPPAGVSATAAKSKGIDNQKQGQYADAIKWLSWAVILLEKSGDKAGTMEVLSCRASCYKEVGEYKKAVVDCSKVLEHDDANVSVLVQRALLYESMEKYKLGAEDLRTVLKIDPGNRIARSTIHRLNKMAG
ncbi:hypothetical protein SLE2022_165400 [Rubroshorea leprosula]